jgi:hypothetical protein
MMIDQADGDAGRGAYAAHGNAAVTVLLQAPQCRLDQGFAAHRGRRSAKFWLMPLLYH